MHKEPKLKGQQTLSFHPRSKPKKEKSKVDDDSLVSEEKERVPLSVAASNCTRLLVIHPMERNIMIRSMGCNSALFCVLF